MSKKGFNMRVWISKYALTKGLYETEGVISTTSSSMIKEVDVDYPDFFHGNEWHENKKEAIARAEEMRTKKIASLNKKLKKLEDMTF